MTRRPIIQSGRLGTRDKRKETRDKRRAKKRVEETIELTNYETL